MTGNDSSTSRRGGLIIILFLAISCVVFVLFTWVQMSLNTAEDIGSRHERLWQEVARTTERAFARPGGEAADTGALHSLHDDLRDLLEHDAELIKTWSEFENEISLWHMLMLINQKEAQQLRQADIDPELRDAVTVLAATPHTTISEAGEVGAYVMNRFLTEHTVAPLSERVDIIRNALSISCRVVWALAFALFALGMACGYVLWRTCERSLIVQGSVMQQGVGGTGSEGFRQSALHEVRFEKFLDALPEMFAIISPDFRYVWANKTYLCAFGRDPETSIAGVKITDVIGAVNARRIRDKMGSSLGGETVSAELPIRFVDGERVVRVNYVPERDEDGALRSIQAQIININELHRLQARLSKNEEIMRVTLDSIEDAVITLDRKNRIQRLNKSALNWIGSERDALVGQPLLSAFELFDEQKQKTLQDIDELMLYDDETPGSQSTLVLKSGTSERRVHVGVCNLDATRQSQSGLVVVFRDVTHEVELDRRTRHSEKLTAIGQLAGGIAHNFNNLLAGIAASAELLQLDQVSEDRAAVHAMSRQIIGLTRRGADLAGKLTIFSARTEAARVEIDLNTILTEIFDVFAQTSNPVVRTSLRPAPEPVTIMGNGTDVHTCILNVLLNAANAMPEGGQVDISVESVDMTEDQIREKGLSLTPGTYGRITVADTGCGMSQETLSRIFEPFFTTSSSVSNVGLGLSTAYGVVRELKGDITVTSAPKKGARFEIYFPQLLRTVEVAPPVQDTSDATRATRLLVVDDEPELLKSVQMFLKLKGHAVETQMDGQHAVELFTSAPDRFDVVIIDNIMPRMNGCEAVAEMRKLRPGLPIIMLSGYSEQMLQIEEDNKHITSFLSKPVSFAALEREIEKVLATA